MQIINDLSELNIGEKTAVALGNFDGIHIGHQKIMQKAIDAAKEQGLKSLCFTFSNHPFNFILRRDFSDPAAVKLICSEAEKIALVEDMGFDMLVNVPFDEEIMKMRAHSFFEDILVNKLNAGFISVGFNYSYGARAEGKPAMLKEECERIGIGISVHDAVMADGKVVSSTLIREKIAEGNMELVKRYLGRPLCFSSSVEHGNHIGSGNGVPTANIPVSEERMIPPHGVYFTRTVIADREYSSVSNIGVKPTIQENGSVSVETNLFDFEGDIYNKKISVYFDHYSRPEMRFADKDALFEQIRSDCAAAKEYYKKR